MLNLVNQDCKEGKPPRQLIQLTKEELSSMNMKCYETMIGRKSNNELLEENGFVPSSLLTSFIHRISYNADDLFLLKKRFTTYHAANSFYCYAFNQIELQTPSQMIFGKSSGKIAISEPKLFHALRPVRSGYQGPITMQILDELERIEYEKKRSIPFRLTPNFVDLMGLIGLHGLFAGVVTSCSMAIKSNADKIESLIGQLIRDEYFEQKQIASQKSTQLLSDQHSREKFINYSLQLQLEAKNTQELVMLKIESLSSHAKVIDLPRTEKDNFGLDDLNENDSSHWVKVGQTLIPEHFLRLQVTKPDLPQEFNRKVFNLIDMALDDTRRG